MELRSQAKVSGSQAKPRATSEGRTQLGTDRLDQQITTFVNSPSSATGVTWDGKKTSRLLPAEGGQFMAVAPQPRSESAGEADTLAEEDPSRRRGPCRESGDLDGGPASNREPELAADMSGEPLPSPDEGAKFTLECFSVYCEFYWQLQHSSRQCSFRHDKFLTICMFVVNLINGLSDELTNGL